MKLVIEIPDEVYSHVKDVESRLLTPNEEIVLRDSVANGTPLPEEHGKLKDADKLYNIFNELCDDYNIDNMSFISEMNMNFDLAQTIIEADKGE